jgi:myo-inositol-1(or 4)-monophosphatase
VSYSEKVIPILRESGKELVEYFGNTEVLKQKDESACSVVTDLDLKTEKYISENLKKIYPDVEFFGEEFGGNEKSERFWLVDPIDGTSHFTRGIPFCTTMVALIESGEVVFSAINDFVSGDVYWAEKGKGARKNNTPIHVSKRPLFSPYMTFEINMDKKENLDLFLALKKKCVLFKTVSCGYESILAAQGKIEGRISIDPFGSDWDYAPGAFLVSEAGGAVFNIGKNSYDYKDHSFIMANPEVYKQIKEIYKL